MKKISLKSVEREEILSREELKRIMGGFSGSGSGGCCAHTANWTSYRCGYSSLDEARAAADQAAAESGVRTFYCCDSC